MKRVLHTIEAYGNSGIGIAARQCAQAIRKKGWNVTFLAIYYLIKPDESFSKIKIDGSFVRDLGRDASSVAVIRAVINIGKILGMSVVAECVESEEQLQFLVSAGCSHIQGYLLGRPEEPSGVPQLLERYSPATMRRYLAA
jgi:hypothetical protein